MIEGVQHVHERGKQVAVTCPCTLEIICFRLHAVVGATTYLYMTKEIIYINMHVMVKNISCLCIEACKKEGIAWYPKVHVREYDKRC